MCTVVYASCGGRKILASLRDESPGRYIAKAPVHFFGNSGEFLMPVDPKGGGSWLGINDQANVVILLNGAFEKHVPKTEYAYSRGLIVRQLLESNFPVIDWILLELDDIEPFTLIVFTDGKLFRLVWNGFEKHREMLDESSAYIFSSSTLYSGYIRDIRSQKFSQWIQSGVKVNRHSLLEFFRSYQDTDNGFIINRKEQVKTLSYSFISIEGKIGKLIYEDFIDHSISETSLLIHSNNSCC